MRGGSQTVRWRGRNEIIRIETVVVGNRKKDLYNRRCLSKWLRLMMMMMTEFYGQWQHVHIIMASNLILMGKLHLVAERSYGFVLCVMRNVYMNKFIYFAGYGNLAPTTHLGRILMIFYALFGIPINGILLANLGEYFGLQVNI